MKQTFPEMDLNLDNEALSTSDAARKALDFYLNPAPVLPSVEEPWVVPRENLSGPEAAERAVQLLLCAEATACESANGLQGRPRQLALTVVHMVRLAQTMVEHIPAEQRAKGTEG
ncbi:DUF3077 domain-containing protein [Pseudomonas sp. JQ170]|uniref:DUF6124 family protein n=1 Tax=unclassified Pseudomonas TaxID=196821 RepID=UPI002652753C|nr:MULTISPECIES: DUF3077 domain-containing protein [unclassified Pseudomonas]MDN7142367.1 DUF3077 domain-containing protein [Pseudomonas sp. JQ170]WRO74068.1 DUF3077 domain-containing protein [Pseudomonas sp. 170C]